MSEVITRDQLTARLSAYIHDEIDDHQLALLATAFLGGRYKVVSDGVFEYWGEGSVLSPRKKVKNAGNLSRRNSKSH